MGAIVSKSNNPVDETDIASKDVDIQLMQQALAELFTFKILCLGAGESGKSTIVKQLKLIHKKKMDKKELELIGTSLHQNVVDCLKALYGAAQAMGYDEDMTEDNKKTAEYLQNHDESTRLSKEQGEEILSLWESGAIQKAYERRSEFWLLDSFPYYIKNVRRFCEPEFEPTEEDAVMARIRTTGIVTSELEQKISKEEDDEPDSITFQAVDVGGQRNERKKWIHCFSDVSAILFIVNLAGYHQVLFEDSSKNRMVEEMELFQQITHLDIFAQTPIFLFLNKKDLFEEMVRQYPLKDTYPSYEGPADLIPSLEFIEASFAALLPPGKSVHIASVSARWKRDVRTAFDEVKKKLYDQERKNLLAKAREIRGRMKKVGKDMNRAERELAKAEEEKEGGGDGHTRDAGIGCSIPWPWSHSNIKRVEVKHKQSDSSPDTATTSNDQIPNASTSEQC